MLGRNHTAVGVAAFAGAVWVGGHLLGLPAIDAQQAVAGTVVAAGAALGPDLDEAHSSAGRSNPISHLPIFGGHRRRTHCVLAVAAVTVTALVCQDHRDGAAVIAGIAACTGGAQLSRHLRHAGAVLCVPFGVLVGYLTARWVPAGWWLTAAVAVPYLSHLLGDTVTPGGVPWLLPLPGRWSIPLFRTGRTFERTVLTPALAALAAFALYAVLAPAIIAAAHAHLPHARLTRPVAGASCSWRPQADNVPSSELPPDRGGRGYAARTVTVAAVSKSIGDFMPHTLCRRVRL